MIWTLVELLLFFILIVSTLEREEQNMLGSVISKIVMILGVHLFSVFWREKEYKQISPKYLYGLLFIPVGSILIALNEFFKGEISTHVLPSMVVFSILLLFNLIIFEIYAKLAENFAYEREKIAYEQQIAIISKSTEEQKKMMEDFHEQKHDLVNELIVLKNSAQKDDNVNLIEGLNHIIKGFDSKEKIANSGNNVVDAIINFKYATAKENQIAFNLKIFIPEELPFHQCDLGIVLGNAIDNAIEAVKDCASEKRVIDISMGIKKEALILTVGNRYEQPLKTDKKGNLLSTKEKKSGHGYGVKSIQRVAEKYHGEVLIETEKQQFVLTVIMNLEQSS